MSHWEEISNTTDGYRVTATYKSSDDITVTFYINREGEDDWNLYRVEMARERLDPPHTAVSMIRSIPLEHLKNRALAAGYRLTGV